MYTAALIESILVPIVSLLVFFMAVLQYRLPFSQVALVVALTAVFAAIATRLVMPSPNKLVTQRQVMQNLSSLIGVGIVDLVVNLIATVAMIYIATYRFGGVEIISLLVISWLSSFVSNILLKVL